MRPVGVGVYSKYTYEGNIPFLVREKKHYVSVCAILSWCPPQASKRGPEHGGARRPSHDGSRSGQVNTEQWIGGKGRIRRTLPQEYPESASRGVSVREALHLTATLACDINIRAKIRGTAPWLRYRYNEKLVRGPDAGYHRGTQ